jgi:hypothetical protein
VKILFILLKVIYLVTMFTFGIVAYYKKRRGFSKETTVFVFFILEMIALLIFDLSTKYIIMLYFMLLASNFASFYVFTWLINHSHIPRADIVSKKFWPFAMLMNTSFLMAFVVSFVPSIGVQCSPNEQYPHTFIFIIAVHFMFTCITQFFYWSNYFVSHTDRDYKMIAGTKEEEELILFRKQV